MDNLVYQFLQENVCNIVTLFERFPAAGRRAEAGGSLPVSRWQTARRRRSICCVFLSKWSSSLFTFSSLQKSSN